jgi:hypothetical protein
VSVPTHLHRRRRQISPRAIASLRREIARHLAKGRDLNDCCSWMDLCRSQIDDIICKTGGPRAN